MHLLMLNPFYYPYSGGTEKHLFEACRRLAKKHDVTVLTSMLPHTKREEEILQCLAEGLSNKVIARRLDITDGTVKVHVKNLLKKLGFCSRLEAAVWTVCRGKNPVDEMR